MTRERPHPLAANAPDKGDDSSGIHPPRKRLWLLLLAAMLWALCIAWLTFVATQ